MSWSISIENALSRVVSDFFSLSPDFLDKDKKLLKNLYLLAKNHTGIPEDQLSNYPLYIDAYKSFDTLIHSSLMLQRKDILLDIFENYQHKDDDFNKMLVNFSNINKKIFIETISPDDQKYILPGSVYEIVTDNKLLVIHEKPKKAKHIAIELTPPCDFSHKKVNSKLIGGFIIDLPIEEEKIYDYVNKTFKSDAKYLIWPISIDDRPQLICFDFRCLSTALDNDVKDPKNYKLLFRARNSLFSDILQKFSSHNARLGVANLQPKIELKQSKIT
jgi:hypothetical protein